MKIKPNQHKDSNGFIQIPILIVIILASVVAGLGGGYYFSTQTEEVEIEPVLSVEVPEEVLTEDIDVVDTEIDSTEEVLQTTESLESEVDLPALVLSDYPKTTETKPSSIEEDFRQRFQDFSVKANEAVQRLEGYKDNFQLLKNTVDDQRNKITAHADSQMNEWADLASDSASSVPSKYKNLLQLTEESILSDSQYLNTSINSFYNIVDLYFIDAFRNKDIRTVIVEDQDFLRKCLLLDLTEWIVDKNYMDCELGLAMMLGIDGSYNQDLKKISDKLNEIENTVFETIGTHTKRAENDIMDTLESITEHEGLLKSIDANMSAVAYQAEYRETQLVPSFQRIKCSVSTDSGLLVKKKIYDVSCYTYTLSITEKCAMQKAASFSASGAYVKSQEGSECQ